MTIEEEALINAVHTLIYTKDAEADRALYKAALEKNLETFRHDGAIPLEAQRNVEHDLLTFDPTMKGAKIDLAKTIDMSFQQKAAAKYK